MGGWKFSSRECKREKTEGPPTHVGDERGDVRETCLNWKISVATWVSNVLWTEVEERGSLFVSIKDVTQ